VDVQVKHRLSGARTYVQNCSVSLLDLALAGDFGSRKMASAYYFGIFRLRFFESGEMVFRNDQHMCRCFRVDIVEGENVVILVDFAGGDLAPQDTAKQAVCCGVRHEFTLAKTIAPDATENPSSRGFPQLVSSSVI
jgi:hypothetical protein